MKKNLLAYMVVLAVSAVLMSFLSPTLKAAMSDKEFAELVMEIDANASKIKSALNAGANPNAQLQEMPLLYYAIFRAASTKDASIVKLLVEHKADVNVKVNGSPLLGTVLFELDAEDDSEQVMTEIVRLLVDAGADVNAVDENGQTPLAILAESDVSYAPKLMKVLRNAGATIKGGPATVSNTQRTQEVPVTPKPEEKKPVSEEDLDAYKINYTLQEIRDPQMNNEVAVTIAVPDGWKFKDQNIVQWNPMTYSDPARVAYTLNGPKDEVSCEFASSLSFRYDYGMDRLGTMLRQQRETQERQMKELLGRYGTNVPVTQQQQFEYKENTIDNGGIIKKALSPEEFVKYALSQDATVSRVQFTKNEKPQQIVDALNKALPELNKQITDALRQSGGNTRASARI